MERKVGGRFGVSRFEDVDEVLFGTDIRDIVGAEEDAKFGADFDELLASLFGISLRLTKGRGTAQSLFSDSKVSICFTYILHSEDCTLRIPSIVRRSKLALTLSSSRSSYSSDVYIAS